MQNSSDDSDEPISGTQERKRLCTILLHTWEMNSLQTYQHERQSIRKERPEFYVVVVNHCFTSLFGTKGLLSDIVIR